MNVRTILVAAFAAGALLSCAQTQGVVQKIDSAIDCHGICSRYETCFDRKYDVAACESRCRETAAQDGNYRRKADACDECITDKACTSATFSCGVECVAVVP
jgi:hypothetical protein